jgi:ABC-type transport system substrate-binding protein
VITDATARVAALRSKQIDTLVARDRLRADEFQGYGKDMVIDKQLTFARMLWLRADAPPFNDDRMRQAIYSGLDIQGLIDRVELGQGEWSGVVPPYLAEWSLPLSELKQVYPFNLQQAKQQLSAAGWASAPEIEGLIAQEATIIDHNQQKPVILDAQRKMLAAFCPIINLYSPYAFTARWSYFHPVNDRGYAGVFGQYQWMDKKS